MPPFLMNPILPKVSSYDNDLDIDSVGKVLRLLKQAWEIAADGGVNPAVKHGDLDESDAISGIISAIWQKYQARASLEQRSLWR